MQSPSQKLDNATAPWTAPHYVDDAVTLYSGDCITRLNSDDLGYDWELGYGTHQLFPDESVDAVVTDPPYDLTAGKRGGTGAASLNVNSPAGRSRIGTGGGFMGKSWDATGIAFDPETWRAVARVLKPGGHLIAFGGSRTWHRLAAAIEDAGFEIRDNIAWLNGSGFPKSLDVSKAIDKAAGAEREVVGFNSAGQSSLQRVSRVEQGYRDTLTAVTPGAIPVTIPATEAGKQWEGWGTGLKPAFEPIVVARKPLAGTVAENVLQYGTGALNINGCRIEAIEAQGRPLRVGDYKETKNSTYEGRMDGSLAGGSRAAGTTDQGRWPPNVLLDDVQAAELDRQSGLLKSGANPTRRGSDKFRNAYGDFVGQSECVAHRAADEGGASRFFPVFRYEAKAPDSERPTADGVSHPTVKPLAMMRWLVRLVTPRGGVVLDPFAGSGTTAEACIHEHLRCIAIEREPDYLPLVVRRLGKPMEIGFDFGEAS